MESGENEVTGVYDLIIMGDMGMETPQNKKAIIIAISPLILFLIMFFALILSSFHGKPAQRPNTIISTTEQTQSPEPADPSQKPMELLAVVMASDYAFNESSAAAKYSGKIVSIEGKIDNFSSDANAKLIIIVRGDHDNSVNVQCILLDSEKPRAKNISVGNWIKLKGTVLGKNGDVIMSDCSLIEVHRDNYVQTTVTNKTNEITGQSFNVAPNNTGLTQDERESLAAYILKLIDSDFIKKIDNSPHRMYVDRYIWDNINIDMKRDFTEKAGLYFAMKENSSNDMVEIYDYVSGKKLAQMGLTGFKVYQ